MSRSAVLTLALTRGLDVLAAELAGPTAAPAPAEPSPAPRRRRGGELPPNAVAHLEARDAREPGWDVTMAAEGPSPAAPGDSPLLTLGARAYAWRTAAEIATKAAAARVGITPKEWRAIEDGNPPPAGKLAALEALLLTGPPWWGAPESERTGSKPAPKLSRAVVALGRARAESRATRTGGRSKPLDRDVEIAAFEARDVRDRALLAFGGAYREVFAAEYPWNMAPGEDGDKLSRWLDELDLSRARLRAPVLEAGIARLRAGALAFCRSVKAGTTLGPADARRFTEGLSAWLPRAP